MSSVVLSSVVLSTLSRQYLAVLARWRFGCRQNCLPVPLLSQKSFCVGSCTVPYQLLLCRPSVCIMELWQKKSGPVPDTLFFFLQPRRAWSFLIGAQVRAAPWAPPFILIEKKIYHMLLGDGGMGREGRAW